MQKTSTYLGCLDSRVSSEEQHAIFERGCVDDVFVKVVVERGLRFERFTPRGRGTPEEVVPEK